MEVQTEKVRAFFDRLAPTWDKDREADGDLIRAILDAAGIAPGVTVLDVACGTGVLIPFYLERDAAGVTGIDLSPEMVREAGRKCRDTRVTLLAGDVERAELGRYDRIMVFNALPHFPDPQRLIVLLAGRLAPGGRLTVAHDRSRLAVNGHHEQTASEVSLGLPPARQTAAWFQKSLEVDTVVDDSRHYIVSGVQKRREKER